MVKNARPASGIDAVLKAYNIDGDVRIQYRDQAEFEHVAAQFGIFEEWKVISICPWIFSYESTQDDCIWLFLVEARSLGFVLLHCQYMVF